MANKPFVSQDGYSVGTTPVDVISSTGNVTTPNLVVTGSTDLNAVGNVKITGGANTNVLSTDGLGGLSWVAKDSGASGYSGVSGWSGTSGISGYSGVSGYSGTSGYSGVSGALSPWTYVTSYYLASNASRIIADTTAGGFTIDLPAAPVTGTYVVITDGGGWALNNLTIGRNGSTVEGNVADVLVNQSGITIELIYSESTWQVTATTGARGVSGYSGSPGGFTGEIQYNNGGTFTGSANLTFDGTTVTTGTTSVSGNVIISQASNHGILVDQTSPTWGWRDILGQILVRGAGAQDPNWVQYNGVIYAYQFTVLDEVTDIFHIPHDYVPGTDMFVHTHWSLNGADITEDITWEFTTIYAKGHQQAAFTSTPLVTTVTQTSSTTQYEHMIAETPISSATGTPDVLFNNSLFEIDGLFLMRVRLLSNTGTGLGASRPFLHMVDLHYQSTNMATKGKAPSFY